jgi:hypothetical protein
MLYKEIIAVCSEIFMKCISTLCGQKAWFSSRVSQISRNDSTSSCPSACVEQLGFHWQNFHEILYVRVFSKKSARQIQLLLKYDKKNGYFTNIKIHINLRSYFIHFSEWQMFHTTVVEQIKTHSMFQNFFFRQPCCLRDNMKKDCALGRPQMTI